MSKYINLFVQDVELSKELAQDVFLNLWKKREVIDNEVDIKSYLFKMGKNRALDSLRKRKRERQMKDGIVLEEKEYQPAFDEGGEFSVRAAILAALDTLKPKTREIFWLHKFEGLTQQEIAEHLEIPKRTVEYNVGKALMALKEILTKDKRVRAFL